VTGIPVRISALRPSAVLLLAGRLWSSCFSSSAEHPFKLAVPFLFLLATWHHERNVGAASTPAASSALPCMFVGKRIKVEGNGDLSPSSRLVQNGKELGNRFTRHPSLFSLTLSLSKFSVAAQAVPPPSSPMQRKPKDNEDDQMLHIFCHNGVECVPLCMFFSLR